MKKKILWIIILFIFLAGTICFFAFAKPKQNKKTGFSNELDFNKSSKIGEENDEYESEYKQIDLDDGTLYAINGEQLEANLKLGDNYFDTTISDMYMNPDDYYGKNIEIEGMFLTDGKYTSVGRYSTSNLCQFCPAGYSFIEYQLDGDIDIVLKPNEDWIKIIGTLQKANDETSFYQDYFYIKAENIEIMNEKGNDTVNN